MRIAFFTNENWRNDQTFLLTYARVSNAFENVHVVVARRRRGAVTDLHRLWRKSKRLGLYSTIELVTSRPLDRWLRSRDDVEIDRILSQLPGNDRRPDVSRIVYCESVNGPDAVESLSQLQPDILIQAGAGILRRDVFEIPKLGTINVHTGIAPAIRGMDSVYWTLWENRHDWLGSTVHWIDDGIDTGPVLAHAPVQQRPDDSVGSLSARARTAGIEKLIECLRRIANGEQWTVPKTSQRSVYRSTFSGWKQLILRRRLGRSAVTSPADYIGAELDSTKAR